eukprot:Pgem_evm1s15538
MHFTPSESETKSRRVDFEEYSEPSDAQFSNFEDDADADDSKEAEGKKNSSQRQGQGQ